MTNSTLADLIDGGNGAAVLPSNQSVGTLVASLTTALLGFGIQLALFYVLQFQLRPIYRPRALKKERDEKWREKQEQRARRRLEYQRLHSTNPPPPSATTQASHAHDADVSPILEDISIEQTPVTPRSARYGQEMTPITPIVFHLPPDKPKTIAQEPSSTTPTSPAPTASPASPASPATTDLTLSPASTKTPASSSTIDPSSASAATITPSTAATFTKVPAKATDASTSIPQVASKNNLDARKAPKLDLPSAISSARSSTLYDDINSTISQRRSFATNSTVTQTPLSQAVDSPTSVLSSSPTNSDHYDSYSEGDSDLSSDHSPTSSDGSYPSSGASPQSLVSALSDLPPKKAKTSKQIPTLIVTESGPLESRSTLHDDDGYESNTTDGENSDDEALAKKNKTKIRTPKYNLFAHADLARFDDHGLVKWIKPIFTQANNSTIAESGLDAYFFLRYLRMLLRIFVPMTIIILPILLPINVYSGKNTGLTQFGWDNVSNKHVSRLWAHLVLAILTIAWVCYVSYDELRNFIAIRQLYLTSPAHRIKASAKTVLVRGIPAKWLTPEALKNLYDVYPGSIRKIWINRNYDALHHMVKYRNQLANKLEAAETRLIKKCAEALKKKSTKQAAIQKMDLSRKSCGKPPAPTLQSVPPVDPPTTTVPTTDDSPGPATRMAPVRTLSDLSTGSIDDPKSRLESIPLESICVSFYKIIFGRPGYHGRDYYQSRKDYKKNYLRNIPEPRLSTDEKNSCLRGVDRSKWTRACFWRKNLAVPVKRKVFPAEEVEKDLFDRKKYEAARAEVKAGAEKGKSAPGMSWQDCIKWDDREKIRESLFGVSWLPGLPGVHTKYDRIFFLRRELARMTSLIECEQNNIRQIDRADVSREEWHEFCLRYPVTNSAFIQFNQQIAAHMACQALSHHAPQSMVPRIIEISPDDILWGNMSIRWWDRYLRTFMVFIFSIGLVILYAIPVAITGILSKISTVAIDYQWLWWIRRLPGVVIAVGQGVIPPVLLAVILLLVPIIFRVLVRLQGVPTGAARELAVQRYYFIFLFIQVFLVATLTNSLLALFTGLYSDPGAIVKNFSIALPSASAYFFSYMIVQALGNSAGALLQIDVLFVYLIWGPMTDKTAGQKWRRMVKPQNVEWGSYFPPFTNFAIIGLVFSIISPLVMVFNLITFTLFWLVQRYNVIYVYEFKNDTGGMLFPVAINQLFTGLYVLEIALAGLFFLVRDEHGKVGAVPQAIIMLIALVMTAGFQLMLNRSFEPLYRYLPITLEDKAVERDEQYAAKHEKLIAAKHKAEHRKRHRADHEAQDDEQDPFLDDPLLEAYEEAMADKSVAEREILISASFDHVALRAPRPLVWLPKDRYGISVDEINQCDKSGHIWASNAYCKLRKGKVVIRSHPPGFHKRIPL